MPQFDTTHFPGQLFWLLTTFSCLYLFVAFVALPRLEAALGLRESALQQDLKVAKEAQLAAEVLGCRMRKEQTDARSQARGIVDGIRAEVAKVIAVQKQELQQELLLESEAAARHIAAVRSRALAELEKSVLLLLPQAAAKIVPGLDIASPAQLVGRVCGKAL